MLPFEFLRRVSQLGRNNLHFGTRPTTFRTNTLKTNSQILSKTLGDQGFELESVPWHTDAFVLKNKDLRALTITPEYNNGQIYVQSLSSMLPPVVLNPKPGDKILDLTAAPGSKTTQIAALINNVGEIVANDSSRIRSYRLKANLALQGATTARTIIEDARSVWKKYPEYFDKVLADVPCSMEGKFDIDEPKSYSDWSLKKVKDMSQLQRWILRSAISATKPGGVIVYSTCTMSPEENEEIIDWILNKEKGNVALEEIRVPRFSFDPPILHWGTRHFDPSIGKTARINPSDIFEGFYIAKLKKLKSTVNTI